MAPTKKNRSSNKRFLSFDEGSPGKDFGTSSIGRQRKRKLSDMLGSQWSKEELEHFYDAYRRHGKDWKKVAALVRNRSTEMVEALYNMNRAYLSLPEGTASVAGLIAMMTDHYNVLEGSDSASEREIHDGSGMSQKSQKRGKMRINIPKDLQSQSVPSSNGCLSLLKRSSSDGRAVGKRTPRYPVSYSNKRHTIELHGSPNQKGLESETVADDDVAHVAALALTEASQRGGSPQVSRTPYKKVRLSSAQNTEDKVKFYAPIVDEDYLEDGLGGKDGDYAGGPISFMHMEGVGTAEVHHRGVKFYGKMENAEDIRNTHFDDRREACSGTEEGLHISATEIKVDTEVTNVRSECSSPPSQKKSKKQLFGDEASAIDALQALADLSLMLPTSTVESDKLSAPEAMSTSNERDNSRLLGVTTATPRKSVSAKDPEPDFNDSSEAKLQSHSANKTVKRKCKFLSPKKSTDIDSRPSEPFETEIIAEDENKNVNRAKHSGQIPASKQWRSVRFPKYSLSNSDQKRAGTGTDAELSIATNSVILATKQRSRRKMDPQRVLINNELLPEKNTKDWIPSYATSMLNSAVCVKELTSHSLSSAGMRRWCTFEWFYSAIDYPWFAKKEFVEYLNHVGLGHIPRLTRVEWGVIRSSLGKPRRFSERFLHEEKEKLKQYRESVRIHYAELRSGTKDGLPTDLARPLSVGQRVISLHPRTREVHDGSILTADHDKCRIQFDHPAMGVEFVMDIDCMPLFPSENMPEAIRGQNASVDKLSVTPKDPRLNGQANTEVSVLFGSSEHLEKTYGYSYLPGSNNVTNTLRKQSKGDTVHAILQPKTEAVDIADMQQAVCNQLGVTDQFQAREADIQALSELTRTLNMKEALLMELGHSNNDVLECQNNGDSYLKDSEAFKKQYATVLVQLKEASDQVSSSVLHLRQRNTFRENTVPLWLKQPAILSAPGGASNFLDNLSFNCQEVGPNVVKIVKGSRSKAHSLVDAAIQAISSMEEGEDAFTRIREALNSIDERENTLDFLLSSVMRSPDQVNGIVAHQNPQTPVTSECKLTGHASSPKLESDCDKNDVPIPSELITSCVATLLMIQTCTERQYPPAEVAGILDSAITSLHPCCPQNLPIYRELQMCVGRIKTQILALIPT